MIKTYRFYYTVGVPVLDWPEGKRVVENKFRNGAKSVKAYGLPDAIERLVKPIVQRYGLQTKLYLKQAFKSDLDKPSPGNRNDWREVNLDEATLAAFVVGDNARALLGKK